MSHLDRKKYIKIKKCTLNVRISVCIDALQVISRVGHQFKWRRGSALHAEGHCAVLLCRRRTKEPHLCGQPVQLSQGEA